MDDNFKMGAAIARQGWNEEITSIKVEEDAVLLTFANGKGVRFRDTGQSCCEHRYPTCDDDLDYFGIR